MTPPATMGVFSEAANLPLSSAGRMWKVQAGFRRATFSGVIWVSGEWRVSP
jgi:hypothetical protein